MQLNMRMMRTKQPNRRRKKRRITKPQVLQLAARHLPSVSPGMVAHAGSNGAMCLEVAMSTAAIRTMIRRVCGAMWKIPNAKTKIGGTAALSAWCPKFVETISSTGQTSSARTVECMAPVTSAQLPATTVLDGILPGEHFNLSHRGLRRRFVAIVVEDMSQKIAQIWRAGSMPMETIVRLTSRTTGAAAKEDMGLGGERSGAPSRTTRSPVQCCLVRHAVAVDEGFQTKQTLQQLCPEQHQRQLAAVGHRPHPRKVLPKTASPSMIANVSRSGLSQEKTAQHLAVIPTKMFLETGA
mmetsp:Transcript_41058/g.88206  ORF Transcript_41058/g.88206 Transcript_41058/m.88206 type:complete len:296 (-) Transcript_41058:1222-2109(-)